MRNLFASILFVLTAAGLHPQEPCLTNAENALNEKNYTGTISYANDCIENFWPQALAIEQKLEATHTDVPVGQVTATVKQKVFANGLLNDVATACFYKGLAAEKLMDAATTRSSKRAYLRTATEAFQKARLLNLGRHWDPSGEGFFWSPAEGAGNHLAAITPPVHKGS